jgi:hypothetical protein
MLRIRKEGRRKAYERYLDDVSNFEQTPLHKRRKIATGIRGGGREQG